MNGRKEVRPYRESLIIGSLLFLGLLCQAGTNLKENGNPHINQNLPISATTHSPISITSSSDFTVPNGVSAGNGTQFNPYLIKNLQITNANNIGIQISGVSNYIIIENCIVANITSLNSENGVGIGVYDSLHVEILNCTCDSNLFGIMVSDSSVIIAGNVITNNYDDGITVVGTSYVQIINNVVMEDDFNFCEENSPGQIILSGNNLTSTFNLQWASGNIFYANDIISGIYIGQDQSNLNTFYKGGVGNYWSDYSSHYPNATNTNGYWNTPYTYRVNDLFPSVYPFPLSPVILTPNEIVSSSTTQINWMPIAGISEYRVYINNNYDTSTTNPFIQLNLQSKGIYNITITAVNGSIESAPSNIASFVSGIYPPSFPLGVQAQNNQNGIMVSWNAPSSNGGYSIQYYNIYRSVDSGAYVLYANVYSGLYYIDNNVNVGTIYTYYITAYNGFMESSPSSSVEMTYNPNSSSNGLSSDAVTAMIIMFVIFGGIIGLCILLIFLCKAGYSGKADVSEYQGVKVKYMEGEPRGLNWAGGMVNGLLTLNTSDIEFERKGQIDITIPLNMITECYLEMRRKAPLVKIRTDYRIYTLCFMAYGGGAIGKNKAFVKLLHNQGSSGTSTGMSASTIPKLKVNTRPLEPEANKAYEIVGLVLAIVAALLSTMENGFVGWIFIETLICNIILFVGFIFLIWKRAWGQYIVYASLVLVAVMQAQIMNTGYVPIDMSFFEVWGANIGVAVAAFKMAHKNKNPTSTSNSARSTMTNWSQSQKQSNLTSVNIPSSGDKHFNEVISLLAGKDSSATTIKPPMTQVTASNSPSFARTELASSPDSGYLKNSEKSEITGQTIKDQPKPNMELAKTWYDRAEILGKNGYMGESLYCWDQAALAGDSTAKTQTVQLRVKGIASKVLLDNQLDSIIEKCKSSPNLTNDVTDEGVDSMATMEKILSNPVFDISGQSSPAIPELKSNPLLESTNSSPPANPELLKKIESIVLMKKNLESDFAQNRISESQYDKRMQFLDEQLAKYSKESKEFRF